VERITRDDMAAIVTGRPGHVLAQRYPFYPLVAPGMPPVGPSFLAHAEALAGDNRDDLEYHVQWLYLNALYGSLTLPLVYQGAHYTVQTIPGHMWDGAPSGPIDLHHNNTDPVVMIVGKFPGRDEIEKGRNMCGPSGSLLRETFIKLGAQNTRMWYVTNLVRWAAVSSRSDTLPQAWIKDCLPLLHEEFRLVRPDYVLCLGAEATKHVCGKGVTVNNMIGRSLDVRIPLHETGEEEQYHTMQVMAVTHPAAVLRTTELRPQFEATLGNFLRLVAGKPFCAPSDAIRIHPVYTERELADVVDAILAQPGLKKIGVDAEWHGDTPQASNAYLRTIQISPHGKYAVVVVLHKQGGVPAFLPGRQAAIAQLRRLLDRDDVQLCGSFFNADLPWLEANGLPLAHRFRVPDDIAKVRGGEYAGGFDVSLAHHAYSETADFKLEVMASRLCGADRWDVALSSWKRQYCAERGIKDKDLEGYGECPDDILLPYAGKDAAYTRQLRDVHCTLLNADKYGNDCWTAFHTSMLAFPAFNEMGTIGINVDRKRIDELTDTFIAARAAKLQELRTAVSWPDFNPRSYQHCVELLFGDKYLAKINKQTGERLRVRPLGAITLDMQPIKSTGKRGVPWERIRSRGEEAEYTPSTDKEVCGIYGMRNPLALKLRDVKLIDQVLKSVLRPPEVEDSEEEDDEDVTVMLDSNGQRVYYGGIASFICPDERVRSHFTQHKETGRGGSARPPLQNLSNKREDDYARILGKEYRHKIRSFVTGNDGSAGEATVLIEADLAGAELFAMAVLARDKVMIDHCQRATLPDDDPNQYDIHSNVAVSAFGLPCAPTKKDIERIGRKGMRVAAKNIIFGIGYGRGAEACARQAQEEGHAVTVQEAQAVIDAIFRLYPAVPTLQESLRRRVTDPGWIRTYFGRMRRFIPTDDERVMGELERQALNFPMQSAVADAVSLALHYIYTHPRRSALGYRIVLQIHDAVVLEVPTRSVDEVYHRILPECMTERVSFKSCTLDGTPYSDSPEYRFGTERKVFFRWGERLTHGQCDRLKISREYGKPDGSLQASPTATRMVRHVSAVET
jgi:uracil-DNA glycosylase family 4